MGSAGYLTYSRLQLSHQKMPVDQIGYSHLFIIKFALIVLSRNHYPPTESVGRSA
jgi:hypothetical protein